MGRIKLKMIPILTVIPATDETCKIWFTLHYINDYCSWSHLDIFKHNVVVTMLRFVDTKCVSISAIINNKMILNTNISLHILIHSFAKVTLLFINREELFSSIERDFSFGAAIHVHILFSQTNKNQTKKN